jgi:hypothetical protein
LHGVQQAAVATPLFSLPTRPTKIHTPSLEISLSEIC